jgi:hypothetical protein
MKCRVQLQHKQGSFNVYLLFYQLVSVKNLDKFKNSVVTIQDKKNKLRIL